MRWLSARVSDGLARPDQRVPKAVRNSGCLVQVATVISSQQSCPHVSDTRVCGHVRMECLRVHTLCGSSECDRSAVCTLGGPSWSMGSRSTSAQPIESSAGWVCKRSIAESISFRKSGKSGRLMGSCTKHCNTRALRAVEYGRRIGCGAM